MLVDSDTQDYALHRHKVTTDASLLLLPDSNGTSDFSKSFCCSTLMEAS